MNCQNFDSQILRFTRGELTDAREHEAFNEHAESCASCHEQLAVQRKLTSDLALLRDITSDFGAPARLELSLRESFRCHVAASEDVRQSAVADPVVQKGMLVPFATSVRASGGTSFFDLVRRNAAFISATAAAVIIVAAASLSGNLQRETRPELRTLADRNSSNFRNSGGNGAAVIMSEASLADGSIEFARVMPDESDVPEDLSADAALPLMREPETALPTPKSSGGMMSFAKDYLPERGALRRRQARRAGAESAPIYTEIATEFLPLMEAESLASVESGSIVRVELSRQALVALGLPMNAERANEPVKADVLIGEDGLARAIRFVR